jgi:hypothetical protein
MTTHQQKFYEHIGFEQNSSTTLVLSNKDLDGDRQLMTAELTQANSY